MPLLPGRMYTIFVMARGWESKSVEQQLEAKEATAASGPRLGADQIARLRKRQTLSLARKQVVHQLEAAANPRHRQMLEKALSDLDAQLAREA